MTSRITYVVWSSKVTSRSTHGVLTSKCFIMAIFSCWSQYTALESLFTVALTITAAPKARFLQKFDHQIQEATKSTFYSTFGIYTRIPTHILISHSPRTLTSIETGSLLKWKRSKSVLITYLFYRRYIRMFMWFSNKLPRRWWACNFQMRIVFRVFE